MVKQLVDSRVLARALAWAAGEAGAGGAAADQVRLRQLSISIALVVTAQQGTAAGQTFNVANGDVFLWEAAFPAIAACFEGLAVCRRGPKVTLNRTFRRFLSKPSEPFRI
jgi:hypothetical protein